MRYLTQILLLALIIATLTGCETVANMFSYRYVTVAFVESLLNEEYDNAIDQMTVNRKDLGEANLDTLKLELADFRYHIVKKFGTELDYTFMKAEKMSSALTSDQASSAGTTDVYIQFSNEDYFGVFKVSFDDGYGKIKFINVLDIKKIIPSMFSFWLIGFIAILVPVLNVYAIVRIKRSDLKRKWIKYIAVICLNVPTITYSAINGFSFQLLQFQVLFGFGFSLMGYLNCAWTIGVPIGGLFWLWRLNERKRLRYEPDTAYTEDIEQKFPSE